MRLDHITVGALTLEAGVAYVKEALGIVVPPGGAHRLMGTHNHLMRLGNGLFLEVIAPDPRSSPARPRWFALDDAGMRSRLAVSPRLITWVVGVADLDQTLADDCAVAGEAVSVSRGALSWRIAVPADGSMPLGGAFPALIEWPSGPHPSTAMIDLGCRLEALRISHPQAALIEHKLAGRLADPRVSFHAKGGAGLEASIMTPHGSRTLT